MSDTCKICGRPFAVKLGGVFHLETDERFCTDCAAHSCREMLKVREHFAEEDEIEETKTEATK